MARDDPGRQANPVSLAKARCSPSDRAAYPATDPQLGRAGDVLTGAWPSLEQKVALRLKQLVFDRQFGCLSKRSFDETRKEKPEITEKMLQKPI